MFALSDIAIFSVVAGVLTAAVLWFAWRWSRANRRFIVAGTTSVVGFALWNLMLNATAAVPNFNVDAPFIPLSWADVGSGVFACLLTALILGLVTDRDQPAGRVVGAAAIAGLVAIGLDLFVL
jgi:cation transporter-like permease